VKPFRPWAFPANAIHVAIDLETASTNSNAAIVQLAACTSGVGSSPEFNEYISLVSNERALRHISKETMEWWNTQNAALRRRVFSGTQELQDVLERFHGWAVQISEGQTERIVLWGNGTEFDNVILQNAFECFGSWPFSYRNNQHMRTLMLTLPADLQLQLHEKFTAANPNNVQHDAMWDARYQYHMIVHALRYRGLY
jgi:hypothetical protein